MCVQHVTPNLASCIALSKVSCVEIAICLTYPCACTLGGLTGAASATGQDGASGSWPPRSPLSGQCTHQPGPGCPSPLWLSGLCWDFGVVFTGCPQTSLSFRLPHGGGNLCLALAWPPIAPLTGGRVWSLGQVGCYQLEGLPLKQVQSLQLPRRSGELGQSCPLPGMGQ